MKLHLIRRQLKMLQSQVIVLLTQAQAHPARARELIDALGGSCLPWTSVIA